MKSVRLVKLLFPLMAIVLTSGGCVRPHRPVLAARHCATGTVPGRANFCHAIHDTDGKVIPGKMQCDPIEACARLDEQTGRILDVFFVGQPNTYDYPDSDKEAGDDSRVQRRPWWKFWKSVRKEKVDE